jgi:hypothetical protein
MGDRLHRAQSVLELARVRAQWLKKLVRRRKKIGADRAATQNAESRAQKDTKSYSFP